MARITVEDCLQKIPNRFELTTLASKRARQLFAGAKPLPKLVIARSSLHFVRSLQEEYARLNMRIDAQSVAE